MVEISIPTAFCDLTEGKRKVSVEASTVQAALNAAFELYPDLRERVINEEGAVRRFVNLYVDRDDIRALNGLDSSLTGKSSISIVPALAGG
jgi:molybdopterin synthase sulfur carrier subunit